MEESIFIPLPGHHKLQLTSGFGLLEVEEIEADPVNAQANTSY